MTIGAILVLSLLGSPHCAAMCGVIAQAAGSGKTSLGYHAMRLLGYLAVGAVAGFLGGSANRLGELAALSSVATQLAGLLLVIAGLRMVFRRLRTTGNAGWMTPVARRLAKVDPSRRALALGLMTALFPCGWLLAFAGSALGTGDPLRGALAMAVFWVGTVPALLAASHLLQRALGPARARIPMVQGALLVILGVLTLVVRSGHGPASSVVGNALHAR